MSSGLTHASNCSAVTKPRPSAASLSVTPHAMLSRAASGIRGCTLVVNLPGSPRGARENLEVILPALPHGLEKLRGDGGECATT